jgi:hypothetical protein
MNASEVERTVSRIADYLCAQNDSRALAREAMDDSLNRLGRASIAMVDEVCAKISRGHARKEARLTELLQKIDAEEERTNSLQQRISQSSNAVLEAELWLMRVTDAMKLKFAAFDDAHGDAAAVA